MLSDVDVDVKKVEVEAIDESQCVVVRACLSESCRGAPSCSPVRSRTPPTFDQSLPLYLRLGSRGAAFGFPRRSEMYGIVTNQDELINPVTQFWRQAADESSVLHCRDWFFLWGAVGLIRALKSSLAVGSIRKKKASTNCTEWR